MSTAPDNQAAMVAELRSSVAFTAGAGHKARQVAELLRQRASHVQALSEMLGTHRGYRMVCAELRRLADQIDVMP
jgi:alkylated DNA nucleotide flippase Atl1